MTDCAGHWDKVTRKIALGLGLGCTGQCWRVVVGVDVDVDVNVGVRSGGWARRVESGECERSCSHSLTKSRKVQVNAAATPGDQETDGRGGREPGGTGGLERR